MTDYTITVSMLKTDNQSKDKVIHKATYEANSLKSALEIFDYINRRNNQGEDVKS